MNIAQKLLSAVLSASFVGHSPNKHPQTLIATQDSTLPQQLALQFTFSTAAGAAASVHRSAFITPQNKTRSRRRGRP